MISDKTRRELAADLNKQINIPWVPEYIEESMLYHAIGMVLDVLDQYIPPELKELIYNPTVGLELKGAKYFFTNLVRIVNKRVDIPYMMEMDEERVINAILLTLMDQMVAVTEESK